MPNFLDYKKRNISEPRLKRKSYIAQIVLVLLAAELFFLSSFTSLSLPIASANNWHRYIVKELHKLYCYFPPFLQAELLNTKSVALANITTLDPVEMQKIRYSIYVPQTPLAIFVGYVLGFPLAMIAAAIYILLGLFGPILKIYPFASGSGLNYYLQPGFGYLIGMIIACGCVGYISRGKRTSLRQLLSLLAGLVSVHGVGLTYMLCLCLLNTIYNSATTQLSWVGWLFEEARNLSWYALPYDLFFSVALIGLGFPLRWLVNTLTAPDLGSQNASAESENLVNLLPASRY